MCVFNSHLSTISMDALTLIESRYNVPTIKTGVFIITVRIMKDYWIDFSQYDTSPYHLE